MIRRFVVGDEDALREASSWDADRPSWYRHADAVFNQGSVDDFTAQLADRNKWFIGIFNPSLEAVVIVEWRGNGQFEGHLMARRGANIETITTTIDRLLRDLLDLGLTEAFCWIAERNLSVRKLCDAIGFQEDGIVMYRGTYRGRLIRWLRYSIRREELLLESAA